MLRDAIISYYIYSQSFAPAAGPLAIQCWIADLPKYMSEGTRFLGHVRNRHVRAWAADVLAVTIFELWARVGKSLKWFRGWRED